jgi:hypothetical protein|tara:strand:+ start:3250 stop:3438 length:189 start_codon:yes stop_codon:yes gene_type:complete
MVDFMKNIFGIGRNTDLNPIDSNYDNSEEEYYAQLEEDWADFETEIINEESDYYVWWNIKEL